MSSVGKTILAVVGVLALFGAIWAGTVLWSGPKGQGDAIIKNNSAENWTAAQARFEVMYQDVIEADQKLAIHADPDPEDKTAVQTYKGVQSACITARGDYNAEARKFLSADWKAADLPSQIDDTDPATDCK